MKITKRQLRRIIKEERELANSPISHVISDCHSPVKGNFVGHHNYR